MLKLYNPRVHVSGVGLSLLRIGVCFSDCHVLLDVMINEIEDYVSRAFCVHAIVLWLLVVSV